jgi:hypothetical protein
MVQSQKNKIENYISYYKVNCYNHQMNQAGLQNCLLIIVRSIMQNNAK